MRRWFQHPSFAIGGALRGLGVALLGRKTVEPRAREPAAGFKRVAWRDAEGSNTHVARCVHDSRVGPQADPLLRDDTHTYAHTHTHARTHARTHPHTRAISLLSSFQTDPLHTDDTRAATQPGPRLDPIAAGAAPRLGTAQNPPRPAPPPQPQSVQTQGPEALPAGLETRDPTRAQGPEIASLRIRPAGLAPQPPGNTLTREAIIMGRMPTKRADADRDYLGWHPPRRLLPPPRRSACKPKARRETEPQRPSSHHPTAHTAAAPYKWRTWRGRRRGNRISSEIPCTRKIKF